jgi:hypothetical protein
MKANGERGEAKGGEGRRRRRREGDGRRWEEKRRGEWEAMGGE